MKKYLLIIPLIASNFLLFSQQTLFFDDFESYNSGDTVINFSNLQGWGPNGAGVAINDPGNGAGGSDQYFSSTDGYMVLQIIDSVSVMKALTNDRSVTNTTWMKKNGNIFTVFFM